MGRVHWVNHAGFAVRSDAGTTLVVDPWFSGDVFHGSWRLLSPTQTSIEDLADCRHVWLSHEHPDHFSPAALAAFPEAQRREMTVWYQPTRDGRVLAHCAGLGYRVRETVPGTTMAIGPGIEARSGSVGFDSWLHLVVDGTSLLNVNDCEFVVLKELEQLAEDLGSVDVLFQQFSYANGFSNPDDPAHRRRQASDKIDRLTTAVGLFHPEAVVPCASFVWFNHEENEYLNDSVITIERSAEHLAAIGVRPVVLYPGDDWVLGAPHDNGPALAAYAADVERTRDQPRTRSVAVPDADLWEASEASQVRLHEKNQLWLLAPFSRTRYLEPTVIRVTDSAQGLFRYDMFHGLSPADPDTSEADVEMAGESLLFCLRHEFGVNTLMVNGRFRQCRPGGLLRFRLQFSPNLRNNHGESIPGVFLNRRFLTEEARKLLTIRWRALRA